MSDLRPVLRSGLALFLGVWLSGCDHSDGDGSHPVYTVELRMAADFRYDGHAYEVGSTYQDDFGHAYRLDKLRFLLSGFRALDDDGQVVAQFPDRHVLIDAAQPGSEHALGTFTASHLHEVRFTIGLDPVVNHTDPASADPPLDDAGMHGGNTASGYCFIQLAGRVDSDLSGDITDADQSFLHEAIGDALLRNSAFSLHQDLSQGIPVIGWLTVDVDTLLASIDLLNTPSCSGDGPVDTQIMEQLVQAMEQEH